MADVGAQVMGSSAAASLDLDIPAVLLPFFCVMPFLLRSVGDWTLSFIFNWNNPDMSLKFDLLDFHTKMECVNATNTIEDVWKQRMPWSQCRDILRLNRFAAVLVSFLRLVFWHWMQPMIYGYVVLIHWTLLDSGQQLLALFVGVREALYYTMSVAAVITNPSFLLVDTKFSKSYVASLLIYAVAPDKFIAAAILPRDSEGNLSYASMLFVFVLLPLFDICAVVAFVWAIVVGITIAPLMIGYGVTALVIVLAAVLLVICCCLSICQ